MTAKGGMIGAVIARAMAGSVVAGRVPRLLETAVAVATLAVATLAVATLAGATLTGCETQPPYADCDLDEEVTKKGVCNGEGTLGTGTTSCVVTKHPHCPAGICASHFGSKPFCSTPCAVDGDCGAGNTAFCWTFAANERYCVPNDLAK